MVTRSKVLIVTTALVMLGHMTRAFKARHGFTPAAFRRGGR
jgi:AraC-like DNA-binding protein